MAAQTEFPTFCERENGKLFAFYSLYRIKNTMKKNLKFKMVKIYIFEKIIGRKSEDKNINKIEKY
jgi:hypothetical protein